MHERFLRVLNQPTSIAKQGRRQPCAPPHCTCCAQLLHALQAARAVWRVLHS